MFVVLTYSQRLNFSANKNIRISLHSFQCKGAAALEESKLHPDVWAQHLISKAEPNHPTEETLHGKVEMDAEEAHLLLQRSPCRIP